MHFCLALTEKYPRQYVGILLVIQLVFAFILLKTTGITVIGAFRKDLTTYYKSAEGVNFVFGGFKFVDPKTHHSSSVCYYQLYLFRLIGILQYTRILPWIINVLGFLISKINGMGRLESYNAVLQS